MPRMIAIVLMTVVAGVAAADWPEPQKLRLPGPRDALAPVWGEGESEKSVSPLAEFRQKLKQLQDARDALKEDRKKTYQWMDAEDSRTSADINKLHYRLSSLLMHMTSSKQPASPSAPTSPETHGPGKMEAKTPGWKAPPPLPLPATTSDVPKDPAPRETALADPKRFANAPNPLALAMALFRAGNYQDAAHAFRLVQLEGLTTSEKMPIKYLLATSLRRVGQTEEAASLYREVANFAGDEALASCAQWQLAAIRWLNDTRDQLERIRQRRLALESGQ